MTDMHLLGHIHAAQINHNRVGQRRGFNSKIIHVHAIKHGLQSRFRKFDIDEARTGDFRGAQRGKWSGRENFFRNVAGISLDGARDGKRGVALIIAMRGIAAELYLRIRLGGVLADRCGDALAERLFKIKLGIA